MEWAVMLTHGAGTKEMTRCKSELEALTMRRHLLKSLSSDCIVWVREIKQKQEAR